jgi:hypothetical protein
MVVSFIIKMPVAKMSKYLAQDGDIVWHWTNIQATAIDEHFKKSTGNIYF